MEEYFVSLEAKGSSCILIPLVVKSFCLSSENFVFGFWWDVCILSKPRDTETRNPAKFEKNTTIIDKNQIELMQNLRTCYEDLILKAEKEMI